VIRHSSLGMSDDRAIPATDEPLRRDARAVSGCLRRQITVIRDQWQPVVLPGLALWGLAMVVAGAVVHSFDLSEYERYAHQALQTPLFHRFPNEYPAPALAIFLLPVLLPLAYPWAFAIPVGVAILALLLSYGTSGVRGLDANGARRLIVYLALGAVMVLTARYDIFAAAAAFWSFRAARQGRWSAAWTWSSVGFLLKLFPGALWPVLLIGEWSASGRVPFRRLWWMLGSLTVIAGLPMFLDPGATTNVLHYYLHRPTEIGSLPAALSLLADGHGWHLSMSYHSLNVLTPLASSISLVFEIAGLVACAAIWWAYARARIPMEAACLATLTVVVLGNKVFSVQYLMWLMPFWALYRFRVSWILASVANMAVFPYSIVAMSLGLGSARGYAAALAMIYLTRDVLIVIGTCSWLRHLPKQWHNHRVHDPSRSKERVRSHESAR